MDEKDKERKGKRKWRKGYDRRNFEFLIGIEKSSKQIKIIESVLCPRCYTVNRGEDCRTRTTAI